MGCAPFVEESLKVMIIHPLRIPREEWSYKGIIPTTPPKLKKNPEPKNPRARNAELAGVGFRSRAKGFRGLRGLRGSGILVDFRVVSSSFLLA